MGDKYLKPEAQFGTLTQLIARRELVDLEITFPLIFRQ